MMNKKDRAKEYAQALFAIAAEENACKEYLAALEKTEKAFLQNTEYVVFLSSRGIPKSERLNALKAAFSQAIPKYVLYFLFLLCEKESIGIFSKCAEEYKKLYSTSKMISVAKVRSAAEFTEDEKARLQEKLQKISGGTVVLECSVDKALLGGVIVEMNGKIIDGSIRRRLHKMREVIDT